MNYNLSYIFDNNQLEIMQHLTSKKYYIDKNLKAIEYFNATVLPRKQIGNIPYKGHGGVVDSDNNFVNASGDYDLIHPERSEIPLYEFAFGGIRV
jgi:hypothetical protein